MSIKKYFILNFIMICLFSCKVQDKALKILENRVVESQFETIEERKLKQKKEIENRLEMQTRREKVTITEAENIKTLLISNFNKEKIDEVMLKYIRNGFALFDFYTVINNKDVYIGSLAINPSVIDIYEDVAAKEVIFAVSASRSLYYDEEEKPFHEDSLITFSEMGIGIELRYEIKKPEIIEDLRKSGLISDRNIDYYIKNGYVFSLFIDKEKICDRFVKVLFCFAYFPVEDNSDVWKIQFYGEPYVVNEFRMW